MTDKYMRAHERLLSILKPRYVPARPVRTYTGKRGGRTPEETRQLNASIKALIAQGKDNREIADELHVSLPTVGKHRRRKLKCLLP